VTNGALVAGVKSTPKGFITETLALDSAAKTARIVRTSHLT
jgi:fructose-1,6-bisphosphatase/sedoheptulose 1,7-bisphosphatase-like protein